MEIVGNKILNSNSIEIGKQNKIWLSSNLVKRTTNYLLEFRLSGSARKYVKDTVFDVSRKFDVKGAIKAELFLILQ